MLQMQEKCTTTVSALYMYNVLKASGKMGSNHKDMQ